MPITHRGERDLTMPMAHRRRRDLTLSLVHKGEVQHAARSSQKGEITTLSAAVSLFLCLSVCLSVSLSLPPSPTNLKFRTQHRHAAIVPTSSFNDYPHCANSPIYLKFLK